MSAREIVDKIMTQICDVSNPGHALDGYDENAKGLYPGIPVVNGKPALKKAFEDHFAKEFDGFAVHVEEVLDAGEFIIARVNCDLQPKDPAAPKKGKGVFVIKKGPTPKVLWEITNMD